MNNTSKFIKEFYRNETKLNIINHENRSPCSFSIGGGGPHTEQGGTPQCRWGAPTPYRKGIPLFL